MAINLTTRGLGVDWRANLPFNNRVVVQFKIGDPYLETATPFSTRENTHLWMLHAAATVLKTTGEPGQQLAHLIKVEAGASNNLFQDAMCRGLWNADKIAPYNDPIAKFVPTWASHFYDPDTGKNWLGKTEPTALSAGADFYDQSLRAYRRQDNESAGYFLGLAVHYLSDLTQPMHAANFTLMSSHDYGFHTDFEHFVRRRLDTIATPKSYTPPLRPTDLRSYFHAVARYTKDTYFAALCRPEWTEHYSGAAKSDAQWETRVGSMMQPMLGDAIQITAQFLLMWFAEASPNS